MGTIYKRGKTYWIKYSQNGKPIFESSKSKKKMVARELLKQREGDISQGKIPGVYFDKITFDDLSEDLVIDYEVNERKSIARLRSCLKHLKACFCGVRVSKIDTLKVKKYTQDRLNAGAAKGSVNQELLSLKRMMIMGARSTPPKVDRVPYIPLLKLNNARQGFFERDEYLKLQEALPEYLKGFVAFAYKTGWRLSEIRGLTWDQVDLKRGVVTLEPGETKNDEGRTVVLDTELKEVMRKQRALRIKTGMQFDHVFLNKKTTRKIGDFSKTIKATLKDISLEGKIFHDLRRTAVRNMIRSGISEKVAMMLSGHKTRTVFDRYNIVNETDLKEAALKQERYLNSL